MNKSLHKLLPVLFGFFVMGFCDVVGISTSYVQQDFGLSETLAGFIPSMVFIWFLLLSIPGGPRHEPPRPQEHGTDQQRASRPSVC